MTFSEKTEAIFKILFDDGGTKYSNFLINTTYDWQTLITAIIAGVPATIAAFLLWRQVDDQRKEIQRTKEQQQIAARIKMPHALAQLSDYWKHCFRAIVTGDLTKKTMTLPNDALDAIMSAAQAVDSNTFDVLRTLVTKSQVFESRFKSAQARYTGNMAQMLVVDVAILDFLTDSLYDYARFETDNVEKVIPDRRSLSHQIYRVLDLHDGQCLIESRKVVVESALKRHFRDVEQSKK